MANPRFSWGIDIGNRALKAIKLVREGEGVRIDDFEVIEHEFVLSNAGDNRETLIQNALAAFAAAHPMKGAGAVAVGVSGQQSFARFIKLPPVEARKIPEIVRFEAIQQIPFPLDEVEWAYQLFHDEASPDVEVGIFAMRKDLVNQHIGYFTAAGIPVQAVQMNPLSVYNAMYFDQRLKGTTMIIDLGAENADLIITEGESIWLRSIPIGGNNFTEALTKAFKLRFEKAEELKRNAQTSKYGRQILQAMRPVFADLVAEIQRSIGFYSSVHRDSRIQRVLALGGTFKLPGLQKYLQQNLSLEVQKVDALGQAPPAEAKVAAALNDNLLSSVGAYGLALQALGEGKITSSLLPQVIRRERMWREKTKWFAAAAACVVAGTGLAYFTHFQAEARRDASAGDFAKLERVYLDGKVLSDEWARIEQLGGPDRLRITQVNSLAAYHETWPDILKTFEASLPPPPPADPKELKKTKREQRPHLLLEGHQGTYMPDISQLVARDANGAWAMPDSVFHTHAAQPDANAQDFRNRGGADGTTGFTQPGFQTFQQRNPFPQPTMDSNRLNFGSGPMPSFNPQGGPPPFPSGAPADPNAPVVPATPQRGFVVTLTLLTPNANPDTLVYQSVVTHLQNWEEQERKKDLQKNAAAGGQATAAAPAPATPAAPTRAFSIPRVLIATRTQLANHPTRLPMMLNRAREVAARKSQVGLLFDPGDAPGQGGTGGGGFNPNNFNPGASSGSGPVLMGLNQPGAAFRTPTPPGVSGQPGAAEDDALLIDPLTGESVKTDWEVVVVAAVVIEPQPAAAPAPAAPAAAVAPAAPAAPSPAMPPGPSPAMPSGPSPVMPPAPAPAAPGR